jgi:hypothetical protein
MTKLSVSKKQTSNLNWRDYLDVHPAAELFPAMAEAELDGLAIDIARHGLQSPVIIWSASDDDDPHEALLDGRNRLDAAARAGLLSVDEAGELCIKRPSGKVVPIPKSYSRDEDPYAVVLTYNIQRRHLTPEQRRYLVTKILQREPEQSNRRIARQVKVDQHMVASVRAEAEATGAVPQLKRTIGADGKSRPARMPRRAKPDLPIQHDLINQAMAIIKSMDHDTWQSFDKVYAKARPSLDEIAF